MPGDFDRRQGEHPKTDGCHGFHFKKVGEDFEHPVSLIIVTPDGKITRYLYGTEFLPFDIKIALLEASQGGSERRSARWFDSASVTIQKGKNLCLTH